MKAFKIVQNRSTDVFVSDCEKEEKRKKTKLRSFLNKAKKNEYNRSSTIEDLPLLHRWQIIGTISECTHLKVSLKKQIYLYVTLLPKGVQIKYLKLFWLKNFFICYWCQRHGWCTLSCKYLHKFLQKFWNGPNGILRSLGETDSWKKPEVKNLEALFM